MISSNSNPKVKQIVQWRDSAKERRSAKVFLVEGFKMYEEAPPGDIREVYLTPEALERAQGHPGLREKLEGTGYETVSPEAFRKMSDTQAPQGILCAVSQPRYRLEEILDAPSPLLLLLENLQDPGNLGTMLRTGEGAGATGILMSDDTVDIYNPKTIRATMGSIYRVPFVYAGNLTEAIGRMRERQIRVYGAHLAGKRYYDSFSFREGTAFLIGNEGKGLSRSLSEMADSLLKIPMEGKVESLNAAVSAALLMYEAHRQRR
ncbi:RNA methyltransferase [uncultured Acetatifactor sp.]|uniref:TrmH family RNA methyltransferase n=1 Tax=uncultured Acetatifactor sp. TaxID=1671927 RepID=UPI0026069089|nr:RNA methyltransferase [uncultured Acetatifactor sp.]